MDIQSTKRQFLYQFKKKERKYAATINPIWNRKFAPSLYHLLPNAFHQSETYILHYAKTLKSMEFSRLHEISDLIGIDGIVNILNMDDTFPGKRAHLLFEGYFQRSDSNTACAVLVSTTTRLVLLFRNPNIVERLIMRHGDSEKRKVFRIEKDGKGSWILKGIHPLVPSMNPDPRPYSLMNGTLMESRSPCSESVDETTRMIPDGFESFSKASESSSTLSSSGSKADIGSVSIRSRLSIGAFPDMDAQLLKEMRKNALVMDNLRFVLQTTLFVEQVMSRVHVALSTCDTKNLILETRYKTDGCIQV